MNHRIESIINAFEQLSQLWVAAIGILCLFINPFLTIIYLTMAFMAKAGNVFAKAFVMTVAAIDLGYLLFLLVKLVVLWVTAHIKTVLFILTLVLVGGFAIYKVVQYYREEHARIKTLQKCYGLRVSKLKALTAGR